MPRHPPPPEHDPDRNRQARAAALAAVASLPITPTDPVRYTTRGRVLIVGDEQAQTVAARIQPPLSATVLMHHGAVESGIPAVVIGGRTVQFSGHLGAFRIELGEAGRHHYELLTADIVIDLGAAPLNTSELPPPGYFRIGADPHELDNTLPTVADLIGTFEKPKYFQYDPAICAHGRAGQPGCRACLDACPADAIGSLAERIDVNPHLCQGGGVCAAVCPTGAMAYAYPGPEDTQRRLKRLLTGYTDHHGLNPIILFGAETDIAALADTPGNLLTLPIEAQGSVGMDLWLCALAWGARRVILLDSPQLPVSVRRALAPPLATAAALLSGLGYPPDSIVLRHAADLAQSITPAMPTITPAGFDTLAGQRTRIGFAVDHLTAERNAHGSEPAPIIPLPDGAAFGNLSVNQAACTLCMACTSVCPAQAIRAGDQTPQLIFHEANCVQCGICANACPEQAINLHPRYVTDPALRRRPTLLNEEPPFQCRACGRPFATRSAINTILGKLDGHPMFQSERAKYRLMLCEDCRVADAVQDQNAMAGGLFSQNPQS